MPVSASVAKLRHQRRRAGSLATRSQADKRSITAAFELDELFTKRAVSVSTDMHTGDVLLLVDVLDDFGHENGAELLASFAERQPALVQLLEDARESGTPVVFSNDNKGVWDGDGGRLVERALAGPGGELVRAVVPRPGERFVVKPRYSAFDHTPLDLILDELDCERLIIAGTTTEGCVAQTAIAARELGFKVSIAADACATVDVLMEATALRYLVQVVGVKLEGQRSSLEPS